MGVTEPLEFAFMFLAPGLYLVHALFTGIAKPERAALDHVFATVRAAVNKHQCQRAILVGHNAHFDLNFLNAAVARCGHKRNPFHPFSVFDTVTLAGVAYGQTVLARAVAAAGAAEALHPPGGRRAGRRLGGLAA